MKINKKKKRKMTKKKKNAEGVIKDIGQEILKLFSAEEKIRTVIEGKRGKDTVTSNATNTALTFVCFT